MSEAFAVVWSSKAGGTPRIVCCDVPSAAVSPLLPLPSSQIISHLQCWTLGVLLAVLLASPAPAFSSFIRALMQLMTDGAGGLQQSRAALQTGDSLLGAELRAMPSLGLT